MTRYTADFKITASVEFEDDGQHGLADQAFEAMEALLGVNCDFDIELFGGTLKPVPTTPKIQSPAAGE
jgi:hypothetical protein